MTLRNNILPEIRRPKLRALLKAGNTVRAMEAHNGISGIIASTARIEGEAGGSRVILEFDAIWESSLTDSAGKGLPDIEVVTFDSRFQTIQEILAVTDKPMIVDGDTGGDANNFEYVVSRLERAGVSAVVIEDKVFPKRNSLEAGASQTLENADVFANKIRRGKSVQMTEDFMIIARIESLIAGRSVQSALKRAREYLLAGADGILIHSKSKEPGEILEFARGYKDLLRELKLDRPLVCVPTTYNTITETELAESGFQLIIYANHLLRSAYSAMLETAKTILSHQRTREADPLCAPLREIFETVGFLDVKEKDQRDESGKNLPVIIPAAGEEKVLKDILGDKPKTMLEISGKPILHRQVKTLVKNNLQDITVIAGYQSDKIRAEGIGILLNKDYRKGTMLHSLMVARNKIQSGFIMLYSDILLDHGIVAKLMTAKEDVVLVVDNAIQFHKHDTGKFVDFVISNHNHAPARRSMSFVFDNIVRRIGNKIHPEEANYEFIGLAKFSKTGAEQFLQTYDDCIRNPQNRVQEAESAEHLTFTDILQEMIERGFTVNFLEIHKGWLEIHNTEDIRLANTLFT